ncbi:MAG TPA: hypothetical protein VNK41_12150 [Vicinamibacterales bacterium]|nr:hypothetical protein [Vicinamibacterales bacterium]
MAPRGIEQLAILLLLLDDPDPEIRQSAAATLERIPAASLAALSARTDLPAEMRGWLEERRIVPAAVAAGDEPLVGPEGEAKEDEGDAPEAKGVARLALLSVMERIKVAMRGTREERAVLVRDPNRLVASAVLSSPKLTESEIESFARMANVSEEVLRVIATNRAWVKNYSVVLNLVRNPKTPVAHSLHLLNRLTERDVKTLTTDRNIPEPLRIAARKKMADKASMRG